VALQLGNPGSGRKAEHVWIGEDATAQQSWAYTQQPTIGEKAEVVELSVLVAVQRGGGDYDDVYDDDFRDRLQTLAAEVEEAVLADATLGGAVFDSEVTRIDRAGGRHEKGWTMVAELAVRVTDYHQRTPEPGHQQTTSASTSAGLVLDRCSSLPTTRSPFRSQRCSSRR
jgi:hypothetical protein